MPCQSLGAVAVPIIFWRETSRREPGWFEMVSGGLGFEPGLRWLKVILRLAGGCDISQTVTWRRQSSSKAGDDQTKRPRHFDDPVVLRFILVVIFQSCRVKVYQCTRLNNLGGPPNPSFCRVHFWYGTGVGMTCSGCSGAIERILKKAG